MALKLQKTVNGVTGEYWQIYKLSWDKDSNNTLARFRCYVDESVRATGVGNFINSPDFMEAIHLDGCLDIADAYAEMVRSKMVQDINEDGTPKVDGEGNPVMIETNKWINAENC